ncbi:MAG TPA: type VI secretion system baseplate subunit TssG [Planctomycetota bacterium]|nr:type VI secretion system baseplate subunit TssG [Planctomycetota bacterium]
MADANRGPDHPLIDALLREGFRFSFFQAVRLLQHATPGAAPVGHQGPVDKESVRFRPVLDLSFAASDVAKISVETKPDGSNRYEVATTFLSVYGAVSPLPTYFTEELMGQEDESLQKEFIDLFHHRAISLFYRVWEKYRYTARYSPDGADYYSKRFRMLLGIDRLPSGHHVEAVRLLGLAGLLTQVPRSASSLCALISDYFEGIPVRIESCVGRWLPIPEDQRNRLAGSNTRLGKDLSLGERVYDRSCTFRIGLGPLSLEDFMAFLPCGDRMPELRELTDLMNGDCLDYEVELRLREEEIPPLQLSGPTARLGWASWLGSRGGADSRIRFLVKGWFHGRD